jgi:predicted phosphodiesterase
LILVLGDVHGELDVINSQIRHARQAMGLRVDAVVQLGDFGVYRDTLRTFFDVRAERFEAPVYFIDGNHEDFLFLETAAARYADRMTYVPRGATLEIGGYRGLFLGGSDYMDPVNTPPGAVISRADVERCLVHDPSEVEIVFTHDCPRRVCVPGQPDFEYCGPTGCAMTDALLERFHPRLWFFAHHHQWFEGAEAGTDFHGLELSFRGYKVLHEDFRVTTVEHDLGIQLDRATFYKGHAGRPHPLQGQGGGSFRRLVRKGILRISSASRTGTKH